MEGILEFFMANRGTIYMLILSVFLGIEVISHVPAILHTPLMSGANAIHGVVIIGAIIDGTCRDDRGNDPGFPGSCTGHTECCGRFRCDRQDA